MIFLLSVVFFLLFMQPGKDSATFKISSQNKKHQEYAEQEAHLHG